MDFKSLPHHPFHHLRPCLAWSSLCRLTKYAWSDLINHLTAFVNSFIFKGRKAAYGIASQDEIVRWILIILVMLVWSLHITYQFEKINLSSHILHWKVVTWDLGRFKSPADRWPFLQLVQDKSTDKSKCLRCWFIARNWAKCPLMHKSFTFNGVIIIVYLQNDHSYLTGKCFESCYNKLAIVKKTGQRILGCMLPILIIYTGCIYFTWLGTIFPNEHVKRSLCIAYLW